MADLFKQFSDFVDPIGDIIINWARPEGAPVGPTTVCTNLPQIAWNAKYLGFLAFDFF
jgi:hypothetical protein